MIKATIDFSGYPGPNLLPAAQAIHDDMSDNAVTFPAPPTTMAAFQTDIDDFQDKLSKKSSGAYADTVAFNVARNDLEAVLGDLGLYVNTVANGAAAVVAQSGFPHYETGRSPDYTPPGAPANLVVRQGDVSGSLILRYRPDRHRSINEVQTNTGDPNTEGDWKLAGLFSGGKATLSGFVPGTKVWVRVRTVGLKGVMGAWSDPGQLMVV
ncbi:MAG: hypothetical protein ABIR29_11470 [Chthoniobacterales bacterium]